MNFKVTYTNIKSQYSTVNNSNKNDTAVTKHSANGIISAESVRQIKKTPEQPSSNSLQQEGNLQMLSAGFLC